MSMGRTLALLCCPVLLSFVLSAEEAAANPEKLVIELSSADYDTRLAAEERLAALGEAARSALEKAVLSNDHEVQDCAKRLLGLLQRATVVFLAFDRDGKPAVGASGEIVVNTQTQQMNGVEVKPIPALFDDKGEFRIPNQPPGYTTFNFTFKDWTTTSLGYVLNLKAGINPQVMILSKGGSISGQVLDEAGKPVKDATVALGTAPFDGDVLAMQSQWPALAAAGMGMDMSQMGLQSAQTDAEGKFKIENLGSNVYFSMIRAEGFITAVGKPLRLHEPDALEIEPIKLRAAKRVKLEVTLETAPEKPLKKRNVLVHLTPIFEGPDAERRRAAFLRLGMNQGEGGGCINASTDENGKLSVDQLAEGAYRLLILPNTDEPNAPGEEGKEGDTDVVGANHEYYQERIEVKSGEGAPVYKLQPAPLGDVSGTIKGIDANNAVQIQMVTESLLKDIIEAYPQATDWSGFPGAKFATASPPNGEYTLAQVRAGRYAILLRDNNNRVALVYGVEVKAGQTVTAPEVTWEQIVAERTGPKMIKGKVYDNEHRPIANASVSMCYHQGSWGNNTTADGGFEFNLSNIQERLDNIDIVVRVAGFRTAHVKPGKEENVNLDIVLEPRRYGELTVTVEDEQGKPLPGAVVSSVYQPNAYGQYNPALRCETANGSGRAHFRRLADGARNLGASLDGYYLEAPVEVTLKPDVAQEARVVLKKGLKLAGRVELPADFKGPVQVEITTRLLNSPLSVLVQDGKFSYDGLAPGEYTVNPTAVGLVMPEPVSVTLESGKTPPPLTLKLVRGATLAFSVPPELAGRNLQLLDPAKLTEPQDAQLNWYRNSDYADAQGRVELWNMRPGEYMAGYVPSSEFDYRYNAHEASATSIMGRVQAQKVVPASRAGSVEALALKPPIATAKAAFKIDRGATTVDPRLSQRGWYLSQMLVLVGDRAVGQLYAYFNEQEIGISHTIGDPPAGVILPDPHRYAFNALPAGKYSIYAINQWTNYYQQGKQPKPELLKTFSVKDGECADLGVFKLPVPAPPEEATAAATEEALESDMEAPKFQP